MKKNIIRFGAILAAVSLALSLGSAVYAVNTDYSGELDPLTNLPVGSGTAGLTGDSVSRVPIYGNTYYDWNLHSFVYQVEGTLTEIYSDAADGMVSSSPVSVTATENSTIMVFRDGTQLSGDFSNLNTPGNYVVSAPSGSGNKKVFSFTIVGGRTNALHTFEVPDGFYVASVEKDGEVRFTDRYTVDMEEEGAYTVEYECMATDLSYTLQTVIDRTPPELSFRGKMDENNRMRSALLFSGLQEGDSIVLLRSGEEVLPTLNGDGTGGVYDPGNYVMRVYDAAGNMAEYTFTILIYLNRYSVFFIGIVLLTAAAVAGYIIFQRKRLKIG
ncbi:MAG: hypothetical protein K5772_08245 [Clostridia bacterium]|nr:hypothetical protein [Clostridia bacterium]